MELVSSEYVGLSAIIFAIITATLLAFTVRATIRGTTGIIKEMVIYRLNK